MLLVDIVTERDLTSLSHEKGLFLPDTTYSWRVAYESSNGRKTPWSEETSFTTSSFPFRAVSFDLGPHFNHDGIASPGEDLNGIQVTSFIEEGFDGTSEYNPKAQGLPHDRVISVHRLNDYRQPNAIRTGPTDRAPLRVEIPRGKYCAVRFLVAGDYINSEMRVALEFADGPTQHGVILCDEWYRNISHPNLRPGVVPALANLDWIRNRKFEDVNRVCMSEVVLTVDPTRDLLSFVLETDKATYTE